ncbi:hypothetical protein [Kitasatospora viridis]|nr:hypothetical protein [Kitasatospora viridis]
MLRIVKDGEPAETSEPKPQQQDDEPPYEPVRPFGARHIVNEDLMRLGLGEGVDAQGHRVLPKGLGWCQALQAPEECWPDGAELCVVVNWYPDVAHRPQYSNDYRKRTIPTGAAAHWEKRIAATVAALESLGYVAEFHSDLWTPTHHPGAEILVYRMAPGVEPPRKPANAWATYGPARPNFEYGINKAAYEQERVRRVLEAARLMMQNYVYGERPLEKVPSRIGKGCVVWDLKPTLRPLGAVDCAHVAWFPDPQLARYQEHWTEAQTLITATLREDGYATRARKEPWGPGSASLGIVAWKNVEPELEPWQR